MAKFDLNFFQYLEAFGRNLRAQALNLGGIVSSGGGSGGPPGGFIGYLPQTRVAYDTDEFADDGFVSPGAIDASGVVVSATLLDNLNHIRYRIGTLETGTIVIYNEDALVASGVHILDFKGNVDVVDIDGNEVEITISGGGGGTFTDLSDTPANYTATSGKYARVTDTEDALIFDDIVAGAGTFTDLTDVPSSYTGEANKAATVKSDETGLEFTTISGGGDTFKSKVSNNDITEDYLENKIIAGTNVSITVLNEGGNEELEITSSGGGSNTFLELTDTPTTYSGYAGKHVAISTVEDELEFVSGGFYASYIKVIDKKSNGTPGGTFTKDVWQTRDLTDEIDDTNNLCSLSSNQITLAAGTYICHISCPGFRVEKHMARLYNITDSALELLGTAEWTESTGGAVTRSFIVGRFTIAAQKTFEIQHYCTVTHTSNGFGVDSTFSDNIYTVAEFWEII